MLSRPKIICHMVMSIDGKVTGSFLDNKKAIDGCNKYYEINREFSSFLCGRQTMEESFNGENIFGDGMASSKKTISELGEIKTREEELTDPVNDGSMDPDFASFIRYFNERMKKILTMSGVTKIIQIYEEEKV